MHAGNLDRMTLPSFIIPYAERTMRAQPTTEPSAVARTGGKPTFGCNNNNYNIVLSLASFGFVYVF